MAGYFLQWQLGPWANEQVSGLRRKSTDECTLRVTRSGATPKVAQLPFQTRKTNQGKKQLDKP